MGITNETTSKNESAIFQFNWDPGYDGGLRPLSNAKVTVRINDSLFDSAIITDMNGIISLNTTTGNHLFYFSIYGFDNVNDTSIVLFDTLRKSIILKRNVNEYFTCSAGSVWEDSLINGYSKLTTNKISGVLLRFKWENDSLYHDAITNSSGAYSIVFPSSCSYSVLVIHPDYTDKQVFEGGLAIGISCHNFFMVHN